MMLPHYFAPPHPAFRTRREFLKRAGGGFGMLALAGLLGQEGMLASAAEDDRNLHPLSARPPHFKAKAKSVIWLFMNGGPPPNRNLEFKTQPPQGGRTG